MSRQSCLYLSLGLAVFAALLFHACGGLAPYRDTGEFVTAARFLNIPHPPGYPIYTTLARIWAEAIPMGTWAYRLNVFSAFSSSAAFLLGIVFLRRYYQVSFPAAFAAMGLFIFSNPVLGLSLVSEMYTAGLAVLILILYFAHEAHDDFRYLFLVCLLAALAMGIRMDLALSAVYALPFLPLFWRAAAGRRAHVIAICGLFFALGASAFLYLPLRSASGPLINWADPSSWEGFWRSVTRASYGSAVDLLSRSYAQGALFWADFRFWLTRAWENFGPLLILAPLGISTLAARRELAPSLLAWTANVPVFLFLANMPLNPHAAKILEDHFIPGFLMLAFWIAVGLQKAYEAVKAHDVNKVPWSFLTSFALCALSALCAFQRVSAWSMRDNFYAMDYARNAFASAPKEAILILHEDVQLFASWEAQKVRGKRPDIAIVGQGLSGTPWYQNNLKKEWGWNGLFLPGKLQEPEAWEAFLAGNSKPVSVGYETDIPPLSRPMRPWGLIKVFCESGCQDTRPWIWETLALRGSFRYEKEKLFFNQDLIEDYVRALDSQGWGELRAGRPDSARRFWRRALAMKPEFPFSYSGLAHAAFAEGEWELSHRFWQASRRNFLKMLDMSGRYHTLPAVQAAINVDLAQNLVSLGVAADRMGRLDEALGFYQDAVTRDPGSVQAHYNLAASYWRLGRRELSRMNFQRVLQLDPNHELARKYLSQIAP